VQDRDIVTMEC